jgi:hypothetical protein
MMKKWFWIGLLLILCLTSARPVGLVQLAVINKSGKPLGIRLDEINPGDDQQALFYYLNVPRGDSDQPAEKTFTIVPEHYSIQVFYIEPYDPVYGWSCSSPTSGKLDAEHNSRLVFLKCGRTPPNSGEPGLGKFGGVRQTRRR